MLILWALLMSVKAMKQYVQVFFCREIVWIKNERKLDGLNLNYSFKHPVTNLTPNIKNSKKKLIQSAA